MPYINVLLGGQLSVVSNWLLPKKNLFFRLSFHNDEIKHVHR